jgi:hypothetical protein
MTGELFAVLRDHSILGRPARDAGSRDDGPNVVEDFASWSSFERGLIAALQSDQFGRRVEAFSGRATGPFCAQGLASGFPEDAVFIPVGGITPGSLADFASAGAAGFGLGSALYKPGMSTNEVSKHAHAFVDAWRAVKRHKRHDELAVASSKDPPMGARAMGPPKLRPSKAGQPKGGEDAVPNGSRSPRNHS